MRGKLCVLLALVVLAVLVLRRTTSSHFTEGPKNSALRKAEAPATNAAKEKPAAPLTLQASDSPKTPELTPAAKLSRKEIGERLKIRFRKEQIKAELEIEQKRYGAKYWQSELGHKQLLELEQSRATVLKQLNVEMNKILDEMSEGETGEPLALAPIFGPEHAGPNVTFLSPDSRAKLEELIAELSQDSTVDAAALLEAVQQILPADELAQYRQWNAPEMALLRHQLVGFNASEDEFNAISHWSDFVNQGNSGLDEGRRSELELVDRIGVQRAAELMRLRDPDVQTAVQDLYRLGLPLDRAAWLADFRNQGVREIQKVWDDPSLSLAAKEERVLQLQRSYRASIAATLSPSATLPDDHDLMP